MYSISSFSIRQYIHLKLYAQHSEGSEGRNPVGTTFRCEMLLPPIKPIWESIWVSTRTKETEGLTFTMMECNAFSLNTNLFESASAFNIFTLTLSAWFSLVRGVRSPVRWSLPFVQLTIRSFPFFYVIFEKESGEFQQAIHFTDSMCIGREAEGRVHLLVLLRKRTDNEDHDTNILCIEDMLNHLLTQSALCIYGVRWLEGWCSNERFSFALFSLWSSSKMNCLVNW